AEDDTELQPDFEPEGARGGRARLELDPADEARRIDDDGGGGNHVARDAVEAFRELAEKGRRAGLVLRGAAFGRDQRLELADEPGAPPVILQRRDEALELLRADRRRRRRAARCRRGRGPGRHDGGRKNEKEKEQRRQSGE